MQRRAPCVSLFPSLLPPRASPHFRRSFSRLVCTRTCSPIAVVSLVLPSSITFVPPPPPLFSPLPPPFTILFHLRLASPVRVASSLHRRFFTTLALPRSSNPPIVRFRRIRRTVMDYRSAHGRRSHRLPDAKYGGIVVKRSRRSFCQTRVVLKR